MLKLVFCLRRQAHLSREAFQRYWREEHAPRVAGRVQALGAVRYVQLRSLEGGLADAVAASRGGPEPYDGVAEVYWASLDAFLAGTGSEAGRMAGADLMADEQTFIDLARSPIFLTEVQFELAAPTEHKSESEPTTRPEKKR